MQQRLFIPTTSRPTDSEAKQLIADVAIVGGGTNATSDLCAILDDAEHRGLSGFTITIFEREDGLGAGKPWHKEQHPTLTANDPHLGMIMFTKNPTDFHNWLKANLDKIKERFPNLANVINTNTSGPDRFARRFIFGIYAEERFQELLKRSEKCGIKVVVKPNTEIISADLATNGIGNYAAKIIKFLMQKI